MRFKKGDKVRINDDAPEGYPRGSEGVVVKINTSPWPYVVQEEGAPFPRVSWNCAEDEIDLVIGGRHPNSARFHELLELAGKTHDQKQADYGRDDDPFSNVRASEEWGMPGWLGAMVRLNDKVRRLQALAKNGRLGNESAFDSFMDIAVYALIAYVLYEEDGHGD